MARQKPPSVLMELTSRLRVLPTEAVARNYAELRPEPYCPLVLVSVPDLDVCRYQSDTF